jgi:hypothetical protein
MEKGNPLEALDILRLLHGTPVAVRRLGGLHDLHWQAMRHLDEYKTATPVGSLQNGSDQHPNLKTHCLKEISIVFALLEQRNQRGPGDPLWMTQ